MNLLELITLPRYGIYLPKAQTTTDVEYTGFGSGFKISTSLELGDEETFLKVKKAIDEFQTRSEAYFEKNDMALVGVLLGAAMKGSSYVISFSKEGITLASLITVNAKRIEFIYEKYNASDYAIQLALTKGSSIGFFNRKLEGDFYFNLKRSAQEDVSTITGYVNRFHLGNENGAKSMVMSAGVVTRKPLKVKSAGEPTDQTKPVSESQKVDHTYVRLQSRSSEGVTIGDIVRMVTPDSVEIPNMLEKVAIFDFAILKSKSSDANELTFILDCKIILSEKELTTKLTILSSDKKKGETKSHSFSFHGRVSVDEHQFDIDFSKAEAGEDKSWAILASYVNKGKVTIDFKKLAVALFGDKHDFPEMSIDINKPKVFFYYQKTTKKEDSSVETKTSKLLVGMGAGIDLKLQSLPIAGSVLFEMNALEFKEVLAMYANEPFSKEDLVPFIRNKLLPKDTEIGSGISISAEVVVNGTSNNYSFGGSKSKTPPAPKQLTEGDKSTIDEPQNLDPSAASQAKWLVIDKKIGPVNLQRLGLAYKDSKIIALLDASIETKGMAMQLMGLGVGFKLDWSDLSPDFYLNGLGLSYKTDSVEISGAFLKGNIDGIDTYSGAARLKMKGFTISAIGSYAQTENGETSLFIYGLFEGNIGGPPIFYITGIAAGFGYNYKINPPELNEIASYPLVALAMQPQQKSITDVLASLKEPMASRKRPIEVAPGNYWLALGVKFTSFKIIESFVLVTVNFGTKTEFNILGLSRMDWPEKSLRDKVGLAKPIVYIELAIKASFGTDSEVIKVEGMITPSSYVLSEDCKLTGGFAFYTWVSGLHAGDFVLTVGGYHPRFEKPAHYPTVSRVGLNWKMSEYLMLSGELYFALTPSAIMMGGRWMILFNTDILKVTFGMWIDLLIEWAPFYYDLSIGIILRIEAHIPLKLITVHLNLEISAKLQIWGPKFSGIAEIDLGIYSFEIRFGDKSLPNKKPLEWNDFAEGFLPKAKPKDLSPSLPQSSVNPDGFGSATTFTSIELDCINATISSGVIQVIEKAGNDKFYIANTMQMTIDIDSAIPVTTLKLNNVDTGHKNDAKQNKSLGIKPCALSFSSTELEFEMQVMLILNGNEEVENGEIVIKNGKEVNENIINKKITKGFPTSLWGVASETEDKNPNTLPLLDGIMSGISISTLKPIIHHLQEFDFSNFLEKQDFYKELSISTLEKEVPFSSTVVYKKMEGYQNAEVLQSRKAIVGALYDFDLGFDTNDEFENLTSVNKIYEKGELFFRDTPKLCSIGYERHNPTDTQN